MRSSARKGSESRRFCCAQLSQGSTLIRRTESDSPFAVLETVVLGFIGTSGGMRGEPSPPPPSSSELPKSPKSLLLPGELFGDEPPRRLIIGLNLRESDSLLSDPLSSRACCATTFAMERASSGSRASVLYRSRSICSSCPADLLISMLSGLQRARMGKVRAVTRDSGCTHLHSSRSST